MRLLVMAAAVGTLLLLALSTTAAAAPISGTTPGRIVAVATAAASFAALIGGPSLWKPKAFRSVSSAPLLGIWSARTAPGRTPLRTSARPALRFLSTLLVSGGGCHQHFPLKMRGVYVLSSAPTLRPNDSCGGGFFSRRLESVSPRLQLHVVDETDSTQDEARRMLHEIFEEERSAEEEGDGTGTSGADASSAQACQPLLAHDSPTAYAVMAKRQTSGRGTQGRTWEAGAGNLFLTVCLPMDAVPVRITLLPLQVAVLVAKLVHGIVAPHSSNSDKTASSKRTTVKWPNDVLVDQRKISGTLIENVIVSNQQRGGGGVGDAWLLIGVGINVESAPTLDSSSPGKHGRQSISLRDVLPKDAALPSATALGTALASQLVDWAFLVDEGDRDSANQQQKRAMREAKVIEDWREFAAWGTRYELRGRTVEEEIVAGFRGETVTTLDIEPDGQLLVADSNGSERRLVADYLF